MVSKRVRGSAKLNVSNRPTTPAPLGATTFMPVNCAGAAAATACNTSLPRRSSTRVDSGLRYSEHGFSRGNRARSSSRTRVPARASSNAVADPAGPAPTTTTSQRGAGVFTQRVARTRRPSASQPDSRRRCPSIGPFLAPWRRVASPPACRRVPRQRRAATSLATRIHISSPDRPRAPPPRRVESASSLAKQLAEHALLELLRSALRAAARPQELQEQLLKIELFAARRAVFQMRPDLPLELRRQLAVQEFVQMLDALAAIHAGLPLMYPISTA